MTESIEIEILVFEVKTLRERVEDLQHKAKIGNLAEAKLAETLPIFNAKVNELLERAPDRLTLKQDKKKGHEHLLFVTIDNGKSFRFPIELFTGENKKKVEKKMNTYTTVRYTRYDAEGTNLDQLKKLLAKARELTGYSLAAKETVGDLSFTLMCILTSNHGPKLPEDLVKLIGKAFGKNFRFGLWKFVQEKFMSGRALNAEATRLVKQDFKLLYDQDFWDELGFFTDGWLDRGRLFESVGAQIGAVNNYQGYEKLLTLPDGNSFTIINTHVKQREIGSLAGNRGGGWYIATNTGWKKYSEVYGIEAEQKLFWIVLSPDADEQLSYRDFYGMNTNRHAVTTHTSGVPHPASYASMLIDGGYGGGIFVLVDENLDLLASYRVIVDYNADGNYITLATPAMKEAWRESRIKEVLPVNLIVNKVETI